MLHHSFPTCDVCGERHVDGDTEECAAQMMAQRDALRARADQAEAERDDMKRRLCAETALRLQGGAVPHATPHSVAHGQFGLVEADRLFPRQAQEGGE